MAKEACIGAFVSVEALEKKVLSELKEMIEKYLDTDELERRVAFSDKIDARIRKTRDNAAGYRHKVAKLSKAIKSLYIDKVNGLIAENDFIALSKEFSAEKKRFESLVSLTNEELSVLECKQGLANDRRQMLAAYTALDKLRREHVEQFVDRIVIGKRDPETKRLPIEIHWNF